MCAPRAEAGGAGNNRMSIFTDALRDCKIWGMGKIWGCLKSGENNLAGKKKAFSALLSVKIPLYLLCYNYQHFRHNLRLGYILLGLQ